MSILRLICLSAQLFFVSTILAHGVAIVDASTKEVLLLESSSTTVEVVNQVATFTTTQIFRNNSGSDKVIQYGFPLEESAAATSLRWRIDGNWYQAGFSPTPQDTTLPGTDTVSSFPDASLVEYLGSSPLDFDLAQPVQADSVLIIELTFVRLLPYFSNTVEVVHPNDYSLIQSDPVMSHSFKMRILSDRPIVSTDFLSHVATAGGWDADSIQLEYVVGPGPADEDYYFTYGLDPDVLGLFAFSTMLPDSLAPCDTMGPGFFAFIAEPEVDDAVLIDKVISIVIDISGSMSGIKVEQAKDAAIFIIDNLNPGDQFNVIVFESAATSWQPDHVDATLTNRLDAKAWVEAVSGGGGTSLVAALDESMPDFAGYDPSESNVILFLTDGQAEDVTTVLAASAANVATYGIPDLSIFTFAIGTGADVALLFQLADAHNGEAAVLADADLYTTLTDFYSYIEFPVLLNTWVEFTPPIVQGVLPDPLPNLYGGQQLVVVGRYDTPGPINVAIKGLNYGDTVSYSYDFELSAAVDPQFFFLTKLWAMERIDQLMVDWYAAGSDAEKDSIKAIITDLSSCYSVISPFTSFTQNTGGWGGTSVGLEEEELTEVRQPVVTPNPFLEQVSIEFEHGGSAESVTLAIYDATGRLVLLQEILVNGPGAFRFIWDGRDLSGSLVSSGAYVFSITGSHYQHTGSVIRR